MKAGIKEVLVDTTIWVYSGSDSALVDTFLTVERPGILDTPRGLAVDDRGIIYVCDTVNSRIVRYRLSNTTLALVVNSMERSLVCRAMPAASRAVAMRWRRSLIPRSDSECAFGP